MTTTKNTTNTTNTNTNTQAPVKRITSRSIANAVFLAELAKRGIYSGYNPFAANTPAEYYNSYTQFRQTVRNLIIEQCACSAASARTMFIYAKDLVIEQVKNEPLTIQLPNGKEFTLTSETLSMQRDLKTKGITYNTAHKTDSNGNTIAISNAIPTVEKATDTNKDAKETNDKQQSATKDAPSDEIKDLKELSLSEQLSKDKASDKPTESATKDAPKASKAKQSKKAANAKK